MKTSLSILVLLAFFMLSAQPAEARGRRGGGGRSYRSSSGGIKAYKSPRAARAPSGRRRSDYCTTCKRDKSGSIARSSSAKSQFKKESGYPKGRKGYVIDHVVPLKKGGADSPSNMQWQTKEAAKEKDKTE
jgi:hypothetical protein